MHHLEVWDLDAEVWGDWRTLADHIICLLVAPLDLVVAFDGISIAGRRCGTVRLVARPLAIRLLGGGSAMSRYRRLVVGLPLLWFPGTSLCTIVPVRSVHDNIGDTLFLVDGLVVVVLLGVAGYDVPGVDETWYVTEHAEEDVDDGVGGAEAAFDPDCYGWEEYSDQPEEDVAAGHGGRLVNGVWEGRFV